MLIDVVAKYAAPGSAIPIHYASLTPTTVPSTFDGHGKKRTYQNMESCGRPSSAFKLNSETADDSRCAAGSVASDQKCDGWNAVLRLVNCVSNVFDPFSSNFGKYTVEGVSGGNARRKG